jgi:hypothetical protein
MRLTRPVTAVLLVALFGMSKANPSAAQPPPLPAPSSAATPPPYPAFQASRYGAFRHVDKGDDCEIWFDRPGRPTVKLIDAEFCARALLVHIEEVATLGGLSFPAMAKTGEEFHFLEIPSARGGNGTVACDFYGVVVDPSRAWTSPSFSMRSCVLPNGVGDPTVAARLTDRAAHASVGFLEPPTAFEEGKSYDLRMGLLRGTAIPKLTRSVVRDETVVLRGPLKGPMHATNWHYWIDLNPDVVIDDAGGCSLDPLVEAQVELRARRRTWRPEAVEYTCLSVRSATP